jgi:hypothetical protein
MEDDDEVIESKIEAELYSEEAKKKNRELTGVEKNTLLLKGL